MQIFISNFFSSDLNKFVKLCLRIAHEYQGDEDAEWIYTLCGGLINTYSTIVIPFQLYNVFLPHRISCVHCESLP